MLNKCWKGLPTYDTNVLKHKSTYTLPQYYENKENLICHKCTQGYNVNQAPINKAISTWTLFFLWG